MLVFKNSNQKSYKLLGEITFIIVILIAFFQDSSLVSGKPKILMNPNDYNDSAEIKFYDGTSYTRKIPFSIITDQPFEVILNLDKNGLLNNKTLSFVSKDVSLRCEVDGSIIYRNGVSYSNSRYRDVNTMYLIDLPERIKNNKISLKYDHYNDYKTVFEFKNVKIGRKTDIISGYFIEENLFHVIIILMILSLFFLGIITGIFTKANDFMSEYFNHISILLLVIAVHIFSILPLSILVFYNMTPILHVMQYSSLMLLPIPLLLAVSLRVDSKYIKYFHFGLWVAFINVIVQHGLTIFKLNTLAMMVKYSYGVLIYVIVISLVFGLKTKDNKKNKVNQMLYSLSFLFALIILKAILAFAYLDFGESIIIEFLVVLFLISESYEYLRFYMEKRDKKVEGELYKKLATIDKMTGLGNRTAFSEKVLEYSENYKHSFYCIVIDIDNLKYVNDNFGHKFGDCIIISLAKLFKSALSSEYQKDMFRMGGDEFFILYHAPKGLDIESTLEGLKELYINEYVCGGVNNYGFSYGYSYFDSTSATTIEEVFEIADRKMYEYKRENKEYNYSR